MLFLLISFFLYFWPPYLVLSSYTGDFLNIHVVAHTHDDTGWIITVDEYYIQRVQWIFDTMIDQLLINSHHKFTYVEMAFFWRWWNEQDDNMKANVRKLVNNGQLQINLGGWCMNDEACPTTSAIIQQMTDGNQFVLNNFGANARPTVAWHVDPFGHSWVTGGLWAEVGYDAFGINRINYQDLERRKAQKDLEFIWKGSTSLGTDGYIFVHLLDNGYCWPSEISFEGGNYIQTDPNLPSYQPNYIEIAEEFVSDARNRASWFRHNHILIPWGCDFAHMNSYETFMQMDKLMTYINSNKTYNASVFYSTLADYVKDVNKLNLTWPVEDSDFFNYVDGPHAWWTGYFTSRPELKGFTRSRENLLRTGEHFLVYAKNMNLQYDYKGAIANITYLRHAVDVSQHHDGISGTETQHTTDDYTYMLEQGSYKVEQWLNSIAGSFLKKTGKSAPIMYSWEVLNELTSSSVIAVVLYNPLAWIVTQVINLPFNISNLQVYDSNLTLVPSQVEYVPMYARPYGNYTAKYSLYFVAENLPPLSFTTFFISLTSQEQNNLAEPKLVVGESVEIGRGHYTLYFDADSGLLSQVRNNYLQQTFSVRNEWLQFVPTGGIYEDGMQNSGAYIFRPAQDNRYNLATSSVRSLTHYNLAFRESWQSSNPSPGLIVAAHGGMYADTFTPTVCYIESDHNGFSFNFYRADANAGWGQNPYFDFLAFDSSSGSGSSLLYNKEYGSALVGSSTSMVTSIQIEFKSNTFSSTPRLLASVRATTCENSGVFVTTVTDVNYMGATVYIRRIDSSAGWSDEVYLDWLAWEPASSNMFTTEGEVTVVIGSGTSGVQFANISYETSDLVVNEPVVLYQIRQSSPTNNIYYFAGTTLNNNNKWFGLNLYPIAPSNSENVTLHITYWAFERQVLINRVGDSNELYVTRGPVFDSVTQVFKENYSQTWKAFNINKTDLHYIGNDIHLGPLDLGAEFITHFDTDWNNNYTWFTCQNSLEYVERQYDPYIDERFAGNYFPCSSQSGFLNNNGSMALVTIVDRAHAVGSVGDGEYDLLLHRRCLSDDSRGVGEVLNETNHIEPEVWLIVDTEQESTFLSRRLFELQQFKPLAFFGLANSISEWTSQYLTSFSAAKNTAALPDNVHLQQLRYAYSGYNETENDGLILQLQHIFETGENTKWSKNETITLGSIFNPAVLNISVSTEMTLLSFIPLNKLNRLTWNIQDSNNEITQVGNNHLNQNTMLNAENLEDTTFSIAPRQIRTFVLNKVISEEHDYLIRQMNEKY